MIMNSENETKIFGEKIAQLIDDGTIIALKGDLGSGKTTLSQAFINKLIPNSQVTSPTFNIVNEYKSEQKTIYHFDLYRLEDENELYAIGFDDYLADKKAIMLIEWPDKFLDILPKNYIIVEFLKLEDKRDVNIICKGKKYINTVEKINNILI